MRGQLSSGVGLGDKSSTPASAADGGGGQPIVAGDHHGAYAHLAELGETFLDAAFDDVFEINCAENARAIGDDQGVPPSREIHPPVKNRLVGFAALFRGPIFHRLRRAFAHAAFDAARCSSPIYMPLMRALTLRCNGTKLLRFGQPPPRRPLFSSPARRWTAFRSYHPASRARASATVGQRPSTLDAGRMISVACDCRV